MKYVVLPSIKKTTKNSKKSLNSSTIQKDHHFTMRAQNTIESRILQKPRKWPQNSENTKNPQNPLFSIPGPKIPQNTQWLIRDAIPTQIYRNPQIHTNIHNSTQNTHRTGHSGRQFGTPGQFPRSWPRVWTPHPHPRPPTPTPDPPPPPHPWNLTP